MTRSIVCKLDEVMADVDDDELLDDIRLMPPHERRALVIAAIDASEARFQIDGSWWTRRAYECEACGHTTITVGYSLPDQPRCYNLVRVPESRRRKPCGGKLDVRWADV